MLNIMSIFLNGAIVFGCITKRAIMEAQWQMNKELTDTKKVLHNERRRMSAPHKVHTQ